MTVVIGLLGSNGGVIGADTQLTSGNVKATATKVFTSTVANPGPMKAVAVGGAGDYGMFQAVKFKLIQPIFEAMHKSIGAHVPFDNNWVEDGIKGVLIPFYNESIMPFAEEDRPHIYTISALWASGVGSLWVTDRLAVYPEVRGYVATGCGAPLAEEYLHGLYRAGSPVDTLVLLAIYVIWHVKRLIGAVGHETEITIVGNGLADHLSQKFVVSVESIFAEYVSAQGSAFDFVTGIADGSQASAKFATVRTSLNQKRQEINAIMSSIPQT
jgi:hypothetical protein